MSRKDYKQGAADAMNAYEAFARKQAAANRHVGDKVDHLASDVERLGKDIEFISDYITDKEKQDLYQTNMPVDIIDLDKTDQYLLLAILYELAQRSPSTEDQQNYIRSIQKYLKIRDVQPIVDLSVVAHIPDTSATVAIMQAVMEYFYFGTHPDSYTDEELDLLDMFMANRLTRKEIKARIKAIVNAVGKEGLAEKYGFAPEVSAEQEDSTHNSSTTTPESKASTPPVEAQPQQENKRETLRKRIAEKANEIFERAIPCDESELPIYLHNAKRDICKNACECEDIVALFPHWEGNAGLALTVDGLYLVCEWYENSTRTPIAIQYNNITRTYYHNEKFWGQQQVWLEIYTTNGKRYDISFGDNFPSKKKLQQFVEFAMEEHKRYHNS